MANAGLRHISLLLVDDDADDRKLFIEAINEINPSINCSTARDGLHAMEMLNTALLPLPDLIFLDLRMPRFGGRKCLFEIKKNERLKHIPVIIYTTSRQVDEAKELSTLGATHFISKPSNPEEIYYLVSVVLEEHLPASPQTNR